MDLVPVLLSFVLLSGVRSDSEEDTDYPSSCLPQLADRCFKGVMPSLVCLMENNGACTQFGNFCGVVAEALQCASDIIDSDCMEGLSNFHSWLRGLQAVQAKICGGNQDFLNGFVETPCFNTEDFLECVEDMTKVTHIVDLLQVTLNANECNRLLIALPTCNVRANAAHSMCYMPQEIINDIIYTFFTQTGCGCTQISLDSCLLTSSSYLIFVTSISLIANTIFSD